MSLHQPGPSRAWVVLLSVVAVVGFGAALLFAVFAYASHSNRDFLDDYGVTTHATVTDVDNTVGFVTVEFQTDGGTPWASDVPWWTRDYPQVGDQVEITYAPWDPNYATVAGRDETRFMAAAFAIAAAVSASIALGSTVGAVLVQRARLAAARSGPELR